KQGHSAYESVLLGEGGENEVGLRNGKEVQAGLGALFQALAGQSAGADGDERLDDLIAGAVVVGFRLHEAGEPLALVGLEHVPAEGRQQRGDQQNGGSLAEAQPAQKESHHGDRNVSQGGSQVGLGENHEAGHADQESGLEDVAPGTLAAAIVRPILGDGENQHQLHPLGGLQVNAAVNFDPTTGAEIFLAEGKYRQQRGDGSDVHPGHLLEQHLVVQPTDHKHYDQASQHPVHLLDVRARELGVVGGAVDLHDADDTDEQHHAEQDPVKVAE